MNHPKGFTVDDRGNIYVADAMNMAVRKIGDSGSKKHLFLYDVKVVSCEFKVPAIQTSGEEFG